MPKFRLDSIGELCRQLHFTPHDARATQLAASEALLHSLDPAKAYPLDFVIYRVTGYHPKSVSEDLLTGLALQHDLGLLIEVVSDSLDIRTDSLAEPVLAIDDVVERFNVTSKTIQRWRRKGLPARRFIFPDGKRRVGFLLGSVERFVGAHSEQIAHSGANFSQVDDSERDEIIRRARRLASGSHCCVNEISRRIARRMHRSPLTILHTIRKHDQDHADAAVVPNAAEEFSLDERATILKGHRRGMSIRKLARRTKRPRSAIYRVILDERIERLAKRKGTFIDDPLYHQPDAAEVIDTIVAQTQEELADPREHEAGDARVPRDLPPYLQDLYRTPLLSAARERALFLKFNFYKFQFASARRRLDPQLARARDLNQLEALLRRATEVKNQIVRANLRLVVSIARKHLRAGLSLMELISDGNITLMRAVEGFDTHKGNRFSTYATLALMKGFARSVPQSIAASRRSASVDHDTLADIADHRSRPASHGFAQRDEIRQLLGQLDPREREVLSACYGLSESTKPATHDEVAQDLGLSKHRVRQIERTALAKLRELASR